MLAKAIRKIIQELRPWTNINIKVIERAGDRIEDLLHKSNPWENTDCGRENCLSCESSIKDERNKFKNCTRRSVVYKTWCQTCRNENKEKIVMETGINKRKWEELLEKEDYLYIGETSRSINERSGEHMKDLEYLRERSHMLKHAASKHPEIHPHKVEFRICTLSQHKTAFERQLTEAVLIRKHSGTKLMNSKQEYTRCYIPKISVKIGEKEAKNPDIDNENRVKELIKSMKNKWKIQWRRNDEKK